MIYYGIFCFTTAIITMARIQYPASRHVNVKKHWAFWFTMFTINMILAPVMFFLSCFVPRIYYNSVYQTFQDQKEIDQRKNKS